MVFPQVRIHRRDERTIASAGLCTRGAGRGGAFTLIELLAVIAIISLLVALLLPSLQQAKAMGLAAQCAANQRSACITFQMYAETHNEGYWPPGQFYRENETVWDTKWVYKFRQLDMVDDWSMMRCPVNDPGPNPSIERCFGYRSLLSSRVGDHRARSWMITKVSAADVPVLGDSIHKNSDAQHLSLRDYWAGVHLRHPSDTANLAFGDGHVEAVTGDRIMAEPSVGDSWGTFRIVIPRYLDGTYFVP